MKVLAIYAVTPQNEPLHEVNSYPSEDVSKSTN